MPLVIGLTGGIGSGKTSAANFFSALGVEAIDTDAIAHQLTQSQGVAMAAIQRDFGENFITTDGALDREKMRRLVFSDSSSRKKLEAILHPLIRTEASRRAALTAAPYLLMVVPLLLEVGNYREMVRRILVVDCNEQSQVERAMARGGLSRQDVDAIMSAQISREERLRQADDVITNDLDMAHLRQQVETLHQKYLELTLPNKR